MLMDIPRSNLEGVTWPPVVAPAAALFLALQYQLEQSQWWPAADLRHHQLIQLGALLSHAHATIPFHRGRLDAIGYEPGSLPTMELWRQLPILSRGQVVAAGSALTSSDVPEDHGPRLTIATSGTTGQPLELVTTDIDLTIRSSCDERLNAWHPIELMGRVCVLRNAERSLPPEKRGEAAYPDGIEAPNWPSITGRVFETGPYMLLHNGATLAQQAEWLARKQPRYLVATRANLEALVDHAIDAGVALPSLERILTTGSSVSPRLRAKCTQQWDAGIIDIYTAAETGPIALQCPDHEHLHVHGESVLVEIVDRQDQPCRPGEVGRVIVTPLHNFATVLLRYDLGDMAEVGQAQLGDRQLPVITRIISHGRDTGDNAPT